jgi:hypothetical protein
MRRIVPKHSSSQIVTATKCSVQIDLVLYENVKRDVKGLKFEP